MFHRKISPFVIHIAPCLFPDVWSCTRCKKTTNYMVISQFQPCFQSEFMKKKKNNVKWHRTHVDHMCAEWKYANECTDNSIMAPAHIPHVVACGRMLQTHTFRTTVGRSAENYAQFPKKTTTTLLGMPCSGSESIWCDNGIQLGDGFVVVH